MMEKNKTKIDAYLSMALEKNINDKFNISVRLQNQLTQEEVINFIQLGFSDANTQRRILYSHLSKEEINHLVNIDNVVSISLINTIMCTK